MKLKRTLSLTLSLLMVFSLFAGITPKAQANDLIADLLERYLFKKDTLDALLGEGNLVKQGYSVSNLGSSYIITDIDKYKMELLKAASKNGYDRATTLAESSGGKVGSLLSASQGIFQVLAPGGGNISDYGTYDKSTIMKEIKAVVTLEFSLK